MELFWVPAKRLTTGDHVFSRPDTDRGRSLAQKLLNGITRVGLAEEFDQRSLSGVGRGQVTGLWVLWERVAARVDPGDLDAAFAEVAVQVGGTLFEYGEPLRSNGFRVQFGMTTAPAWVYAQLVAKETVSASGDLQRDLRALGTHFHPIREQIRLQIETLLQSYAGQRARSLAEGKETARRINDLLASFGLRLRFPRGNAAATLQFKALTRRKPGGYVLAAVVDGRLTAAHGSPELPNLDVVVAPPDGRRRRGGR